MPKKFAYIKVHSHAINISIMKTLMEHFPEYEMDVIDVSQLLRKRRSTVFMNMLFVLKEYGLEILIGRKRIRECFWRTTYIFRSIKTLISGILTKSEYQFSFQNQSMFDGSKDGLPHYVYTDHTHLANLHYPGFDSKNLYSRRWIEMEKTIYQNATQIFTRNSLTATSIIDDYNCPPYKVVCVYAGSNINTDFEVDRSKYTNKNILFVGIEWDRKGGPELIQVFKQVLQVHPTARLTIVGCSPKLHNIRNCDVVGMVPLEELNDYYEKASIFCLPSKLEPYAIAQLEAFAHGLPVVTTDLGMEHDYVSDGENGHLVKLGDIERLKEVLNRLLDDPEKCRIMGENGRRLFLDRFTWESVGAEIANHIIATMKTNKRGNDI